MKKAIETNDFTAIKNQWSARSAAEFKKENGITPLEYALQCGGDSVELIGSLMAKDGRGRHRNQVSSLIQKKVNPKHPAFSSVVNYFIKAGGVIPYQLDLIAAELRMREDDIESFQPALSVKRAPKLIKFLGRRIIEQFSAAHVADAEFKKVIKNIVAPATFFNLPVGDLVHINDFFLASGGKKPPVVRDVTDSVEVESALGQLNAAIKEWDALLREQGLSGTGRGVTEVVEDLGEGFELHQLMDENALRFEGRMMGHCVGGGAYNRFLDQKDAGIFSVRRGGVPEATLQIEGSYLKQIQGRRNGRVHPDAMKSCVRVIEKKGLKMMYFDFSKIGYKEVSDIDRELFDFETVTIGDREFMFLPEVSVKEDLCLKDDHVFSFKEFFKVATLNHDLITKCLGLKIAPDLFEIAVRRANTDAVMNFLENSPRANEMVVNAPDCISLAIAKNSAPLMKKLLEIGTKYWPKDEGRHSPLVFCFFSGKTELALMMLDAGVSLDDSPSKIKPRDWLRKFGSDDLLRLLKSEGHLPEDW